METVKRSFASGKRLKRIEGVTGWLMITPALVLFLAFVLYPAISTFSLSFFDWDLLTEREFVGFENFGKLFADERLGLIIGNTLLLTVVSVILKVALGFLLAYFVFRLRNKFGSVFMESAIFFPIIIPMSIISMVFVILFSTDTGAINGILYMLGLPKVPWLSSASMSLWSVLLVDVWKGIGFFFIIYLVAIRNIPQSYLEAADMDGAGNATKLFRIILPCVSATSLFLVINALITCLQLFEPVYLLTRGGPGDSSNVISYYIWSVAFQERDIGYGSVLALVLFVFVMVVTIAQFAISKFWVHYDE